MLYSVQMTNPSLCDSLGGCVTVCPEGVWKWSNALGRKLPVPVNQDKCTGCMRCVRICPQGIIKISPSK